MYSRSPEQQVPRWRKVSASVVGCLALLSVGCSGVSKAQQSEATATTSTTIRPIPVLGDNFPRLPGSPSDNIWRPVVDRLGEIYPVTGHAETEDLPIAPGKATRRSAIVTCVDISLTTAEAGATPTSLVQDILESQLFSPLTADLAPDFDASLLAHRNFKGVEWRPYRSGIPVLSAAEIKTLTAELVPDLLKLNEGKYPDAGRHYYLQQDCFVSFDGAGLTSETASAVDANPTS